ncbi:MAG: SO2930 family diheme c-type cytochrome [Hyphomonadaceae bacterium]|nr:SO2930 family diheme c-type cytochrome [Hyphomonadaceae bacterium]
MRRVLFSALAALALCVSATAQPAPTPVDQRAVMAQRPPETLAAYRFFTDAGARTANAGVTPYDLATPLWSDGALKFRYLYLPPGTRATYRADGVFELPVGAVLIKTFAFAPDMRRPTENVRFLETRLLIHRADGWVALPYVWNEEQTEARLSVIGATIPIEFTNAEGAAMALEWSVPNRNQCKGCHDLAGEITPIGPTAANLNRSFDYGDGAEAQLAHWLSAGLIDQVPADAPRAANAYDPASGTLEQRARAYLSVNCAHCHNPDGPAHTSGLDLRASTHEPIAWGVGKRPTAAGRGSAGMQYAISPGHPEQSFLLFRMESDDPGTMMPELGRSITDDRAIALMREWIAGMGPDGRVRE